MKNSLSTFLNSRSYSPGKMLAKFFCALLYLLGTLVFSTQANAGILYATTAAGAAGELYILDAATGAMIQDVGPLNDSGAVNYPITGLAFHPVTGVLYGSTGNNPAATAATLVSINPATAEVTVIGPFNAGNVGTPATMADLAFDLATGILYGVGSVGGPQLYSINITNGQATLIGTNGLTSTTGGGLAVSSGGVFYGTPTANRFGTYDMTTGALTVITNVMVRPAGGGGYGALDFNWNGVLYGLNVGPGSPPPTHLVTIDPTTGAVTDLGASPNSIDAIAFQPPALAIALAGNQVTLRWPSDSTGFNLEYKTNLNSGIWLTNTTPPISVNGTNSLTLPIVGVSTFFRLHKP